MLSNAIKQRLEHQNGISNDSVAGPLVDSKAIEKAGVWWKSYDVFKLWDGEECLSEVPKDNVATTLQSYIIWEFDTVDDTRRLCELIWFH